MLDKLHEAEDALPDLLREGVDAWRSLDIDYEPPRVERLWRPWGPVVSTGAMSIPSRFRINLHRIGPCESALFHPHPWPSAVRIITGRYEMGVGTRSVNQHYNPPEICRMVLGPGDQYEMVDPAGWHYVKPLDEPSLSVMITARPFTEQIFDHRQFGKREKLGELGLGVKTSLLAEFTSEYHYWRKNR